MQIRYACFLLRQLRTKTGVLHGDCSDKLEVILSGCGIDLQLVENIRESSGGFRQTVRMDLFNPRLHHLLRSGAHLLQARRDHLHEARRRRWNARTRRRCCCFCCCCCGSRRFEIGHGRVTIVVDFGQRFVVRCSDLHVRLQAVELSENDRAGFHPIGGVRRQQLRCDVRQCFRESG